MKTRTAMALAAALIVAGAALPAHAAGPLNDKGEVGTFGKQWSNAVPGQNPLTADEAAATLALFLRCDESGNTNLKHLNLPAFQADIEAGGNEAADFRNGGKYNHLVRKYLTEWRVFDGIGPMMIAFCLYHPYSGQ